MTTLYLIRHAQALGNLNNRCQGTTDEPLSDLGRKQLDFLAQRCKELPAVHIYSSPLIRAKDTALAANRYLSLPLTLDPDLQELNFGAWEGRLISDIEVTWPEERDIWRRNIASFVSPGGESMAQLYERMHQALLRIAAAHRGETVLVATHGASLSAAFAWAKGGPEHMSREFIVRNTAVSKIEIDRQNTPHLIFTGDVSHLPQECRS